MSYYPRLKDLREDKDLTQTDIARFLQTTQSYYGQYERGEKEIRFDIAIKLAEFYGVSLDYIAGRTNNKGGIGCDKNSKYNFNIQGNTNIKIKE